VYRTGLVHIQTTQDEHGGPLMRENHMEGNGREGGEKKFGDILCYEVWIVGFVGGTRRGGQKGQKKKKKNKGGGGKNLHSSTEAHANRARRLPPVNAPDL